MLTRALTVAALAVGLLAPGLQGAPVVDAPTTVYVYGSDCRLVGSPSSVSYDSVVSPVVHSLRRVLPSYTGTALQLTRQDGTAQDIGFLPNGDLNTTQALNFIGSGDGYVSIWYDQGPTSNHVIQQTLSNRPQLITAGQLNMMNGKPAIRFDKARSTYFNMNKYPFQGANSFITYITSQTVSDNQWQRLFDFGYNTTNFVFATPAADPTNGGGVKLGLRHPSVPADQYTTNTNYKLTSPALTTFEHTGSQLQVISNGATRATGAITSPPSVLNGANNNYIGRSEFSFDSYLDALISEMLWYGQDLNTASTQAQHQAIQNNIQNYWNVSVSPMTIPASDIKLECTEAAPVSSPNSFFTFTIDGLITLKTPLATMMGVSALCLDSRVSTGVRVVKPTICDTTKADQHWIWHANGQIENTGTGLCMDALPAGGVQQDTPISLQSCNGTNPLTQTFAVNKFPNLPFVPIASLASPGIRVPPPVLVTQTSSIYVLGTSVLLQADSNLAIGSQVKLNDNPGAPGSNEQWTFELDGSILMGLNGGFLCLDSGVPSSGTPNAASYNVIITLCVTNKASQRWKWLPNSLLQNTLTGYCLDATVNGVSSGAAVTVTKCRGATGDQLIVAQQWSDYIVVPSTAVSTSSSYIVLDPITKPIYLVGTNFLLQINASTPTFLTPVTIIQNAGNVGPNQVWTFNVDGTIRTSYGSSGSTPSWYCFDVLTQGSAQLLVLVPCDVTNPNQRWSWRSNGQIANLGAPGGVSGLCLDALKNGFSAQQPIAVKLLPCGNNANGLIGQQFLQDKIVSVQPPTTPTPDGNPTPIYLFGTNYAIDVPNAPNTAVKLTTSGSPVQWSFVGSAIVSSSGQCLDSGASVGSSNRYQVTVRQCDGSANQQWSWQADSSIINTQNNFCLDAAVNGIGGGIQLAVAKCAAANGLVGALTQQFTTQITVQTGNNNLLLPAGVTPLLTNSFKKTNIYLFGTNLALTLNNSNTVTLGSTPSDWQLNYDGTISSFSLPGVCLVRSGTGSVLSVSSCVGAGSSISAQQWSWNSDTYQIKNLNNGLCLDASTNGANAGVALALKTCTPNTLAQRFIQALITAQLPKPSYSTNGYNIYLFGTGLTLNTQNTQNAGTVALTQGSGPVGGLWTFNYDGTITVSLGSGKYCVGSSGPSGVSCVWDPLHVRCASPLSSLSRDTVVNFNDGQPSTAQVVSSPSGRYIMSVSSAGDMDILDTWNNYNLVGQKAAVTLTPQNRPYNGPVKLWLQPDGNFCTYPLDGSQGISTGQSLACTTELVGFTLSSAARTFQIGDDGKACIYQNGAIIICLPAPAQGTTSSITPNNNYGVVLSPCSSPPQATQLWTWHTTAPGTLRANAIENIGTPGYCLDAAVNGAVNGTTLALAPCSTQAKSRYQDKSVFILTQQFTTENYGAPQYAPCPKGTAGTELCVKCPPGKFTATEGQAVCSLCPAGTYSAGFGSTSCTPCPAGSFSGADGSSTCPVCPPGQITANSGLTSCTPCSAGTIAATSNSTSCSPCSSGSFSNTAGSDHCQFCPSGTISTGSASTGCTSCPAGTIASGSGLSSCSPCPTGQIAATSGLSQCTPCQAGSISINNTQCTPCPAGSIAATSGLGTCTPCPAGQVAATAGLSVCTPCQAGNFANTTGLTVCTPCQAGNIAANSGSTGCTPCPAGQIAASNGASVCQPCGPGTYANLGTAGASTTCTPCAAGTFAFNSGSATCTPCAAGTYATDTNTITCSPCAAGFTSTVTSGATSCRPCAAGQFSPSAGSPSCTPCPTGKFSDSLNSTACTPCPAGTSLGTSGGNSANSCQPCPPGWWAIKGSATCTQCLANNGQVNGVIADKYVLLPNDGSYSNIFNNNNNNNNLPTSTVVAISVVCTCIGTLLFIAIGTLAHRRYRLNQLKPTVSHINTDGKDTVIELAQ